MQDIISLLRQLEWKLHGSSCKWAVCQLPGHIHHNYTPSFSVYQYRGKQYFKCHGCGAKGNIVDLAGYLWVDGYQRGNKDHYREAKQKLGGNVSPAPFVAKPGIPDIPQYAAEMFLPLASNVRKYANGRGISNDVIDRYFLGSATRLVFNDSRTRISDVIKADSDLLLAIPTTHGRELRGIKFRQISGKAKYRYFSYPGSRKGIIGFNDVNLTEDVVLVLKGEIAALVGISHGLKCCAPTGGEGSVMYDQVYPLIFAKNIVVGDNNLTPALMRATEERAKQLHALLKFPSAPYDFDEWLLADKNALEEIKRWQEERIRVSP